MMLKTAVTAIVLVVCPPVVSTRQPAPQIPVTTVETVRPPAPQSCL